jgi:RNA polymerase sigma factor (sigma-70 family)
VYTDKELLVGIRQNNNKILEYIYREYFPAIRSLVLHNGGNIEDAEDLFNEGMAVLFKKARSRKIHLSSKLKTYLYAVCKNLWFQQLEQRMQVLYYTKSYVAEKKPRYYVRPDNNEEIKEEINRILWKHFKRLPKDCQKLLQLYVEKVPFKEITKKFNYVNKDYAKVRKFVCKERLRRWLLEDPGFTKITTYDK